MTTTPTLPDPRDIADLAEREFRAWLRRILPGATREELDREGILLTDALGESLASHLIRTAGSPPQVWRDPDTGQVWYGSKRLAAMTAPWYAAHPDVDERMAAWETASW